MPKYSKFQNNGYPLKIYIILTDIIPKNIYTYLIFRHGVQSVFEVVLKFCI